MEILTPIFLLFIAMILLFVLNNVAATRRYSLAQFHLNLKQSNLTDDEKIKLSDKYGLTFDPEKD